MPLAHRRICGPRGRAFALVKPPGEEETKRDKLCPASRGVTISRLRTPRASRQNT